MIKLEENLSMEIKLEKIKANIRNHTEGNYVPPSPDDLRFIMAINNWSQIDVAKLVGASYSIKHGSTTVRKWCSEKGNKEYRQISYPAWRLLLSYSVKGMPANKEDAARIIGRIYGGN